MTKLPRIIPLVIAVGLAFGASGIAPTHAAAISPDVALADTVVVPDTALISPAGSGAISSDQAAHGDRLHRLVIAGVIVSVADTGAVEIDLRETDDDPNDNYSVMVTADTRIRPPDAAPAAGAHAKALVSQDEDGNLVASLLVLARRSDHPDEPGPRPHPTHRARVCGTIASLPDDPASGEWVIEAGDMGDVAFAVTGDTLITPPNVSPAVDMRACAQLSGGTDAPVAEKVQLHPVRDGSGSDRDRDRRHVELRGTVAGVPGDMTGDWTLSVAIEGRDAPVDVQVGEETEIRGELAQGVAVVVKATMETTASGDTILTAERILVVGPDAGKGHDKRALSFHGTVEAVAEDGTWTIATDDGTVQVMVSDHTRIVGLAADESPIGLDVQVVAAPTAAGLQAKLIRIER